MEKDKEKVALVGKHKKMCGIFGVIGKRIEKSIAEKCINTMIHRGPDGSGIWQEGDVLLGHRRLSILDLSDDGKQPMEYLDRYVITFNGEVYNFIEIRDELLALGYVFRTGTDTEVIIAAYDQWKEKCLNKFNGMFAFCIYDRKEKECFLARDRFGVKPFFWTKNKGGEYIFASEMKAILPVMDNREINRKLLLNTDVTSINRYESSDDSLVLGITKLKAGHYAIIKEGNIQIDKWWDVLDNLMEVPQDYDEQTEMFRELFLDACKIRMRSDVKIGTALSGGLDSSSTISVMSYVAKNMQTRKMSEDWQHAYIACFPGTDVDEKEYARMVVENIGINGTYLDIDPVRYWDKIGDDLYLFEEVYQTTPVPMMETYNAEKMDGTKVTIDGHGADELFGGYTYDIFHALYNRGITRGDFKQIIEAYSEGKDISNTEYFKIIYKVLGHKIKNKVMIKGDDKRIEQLHDDTADWRRMTHFDKLLYDESFCSILPTLLRNYDRYSMANSVEIRTPFMDYRVVSFAFSIGWRSKIRNGFSKAIIRDAVAPYMPERVTYRRNKIGFTTPLLDWIHGDLKEWFLDISSSRDFIESDLIDGNKLSNHIKTIVSDDFDMKHCNNELSNIWMHISPFLWKKYFWDRAVAETT